MPFQSANNIPPAPRGRMIDTGAGHSLHAVFAGEGDGPLVVLEAGAFGFSADWAAVQDLLARRGLRSMAYDRAGLGFSEPGPDPRDSLAIVGDLDRLLAAVGARGPLILCGHSMAGLHVRLFTAANRERVAGVVLVDATTPEAMEQRSVSGFVEHFARASRLAAWGAGAGLLGPLSGTALGDFIGLEGPAGLEKRWAFADGKHNHWAAREVASWADSAREGREATPFDPDLPVAVILTGAAGQATGFRAVQLAPAQASRLGSVDYANGATHATMLNGAHAEVIIRGIERVRAAAGV